MTASNGTDWAKVDSCVENGIGDALERYPVPGGWLYRTWIVNPVVSWGSGYPDNMGPCYPCPTCGEPTHPSGIVACRCEDATICPRCDKWTDKDDMEYADEWDSERGLVCRDCKGKA
jgi:hypothetical protein